jgi:hypothetical protein
VDQWVRTCVGWMGALTARAERQRTESMKGAFSKGCGTRKNHRKHVLHLRQMHRGVHVILTKQNRVQTG